MIQAASFIDSQLNHLFGTRSQANLTKDDAISTPNNKFNGAANFVQLNAQITQYFCSNTFTFAHKTEKKVLCTDIVVLEALGFLLSETQDFPGPLCELVKPISIVHLFVTPLSVAEGGTEPSVMLR